MSSSTQRILINSLPKSGTNLLSRAFELAGFQYGALGVSSALVMGSWQLTRQFARRSFFELNPLIIGLDVQMPVRRSWLDGRLARVPAGNYVTGHANWTIGLEHLLTMHGFRTVLVIRDPRDVVLSYGHYVAATKAHFLHRTYSRIDLVARTRLTLEGGRIDGLDVAPFAMMLDRIDRWIGRPGVEVIRFEDAVGPAGGGSAARQRDVFDALSRFTGRIFDPVLSEMNLYGHSHTFRKGRIGSAAEELDTVTLAQVNAVLDPMLRKWGYNDG
jgi:hypothetical protein